MTLEQARELRDLLNEMFGKEPVRIYSPIFQPVVVPYPPYWSGDYWAIGSGDTTGEITVTCKAK